MEKLMDIPIDANVIKRYGKYTKKVNGELVKVIYDWFERETGSKYKLELTKEQYDRMKSLVRWSDGRGDQLTFDQFCDILVPILTGHENETHDDYAIWLAFQVLDQNGDDFISIDEFVTLMEVLGKALDRDRIRFFLDNLDPEHHGHFDFHQFRQFLTRGYARELLMQNVSREILY